MISADWEKFKCEVCGAKEWTQTVLPSWWVQKPPPAEAPVPREYVCWTCGKCGNMKLCLT